MENLYLMQFFTIAAVHLLAAVAPGPDFAIVIKQSITYGRRTAVLTSLGVGLGILIHVSYSLLGIGLVISKSILAFSLMKMLAAAYLIYIGIKALRTKPYDEENPFDISEMQAPDSKQAILTGFMSNGLNPKVALFMLSIFTVVISPDTPTLIRAGYGLYMAFASGFWFTLVACFFSSDHIRNVFQQVGHWFDRIMGSLLIGLGVKLVTASNN